MNIKSSAYQSHITVRIKPELRRSLDEIAEKEGTQLSSIIRKVLIEYTEKVKSKKKG